MLVAHGRCLLLMLAPAVEWPPCPKLWLAATRALCGRGLLLLNMLTFMGVRRDVSAALLLGRCGRLCKLAGSRVDKKYACEVRNLALCMLSHGLL